MNPNPRSPSYRATTPSPARAGTPPDAGSLLLAGACPTGAGRRGGGAGSGPSTSCTSRACGPLSPLTTSYATRSPSVSQVRPSPRDRAWTKTSPAPESGAMKPNPLSSSYQEPVPSAPSAPPAPADRPAPGPSGTTCAACGPRSPSTTTKATRCPSVTTPPVTMAELCTKMSGPPPSGEANPYPLAGSYQLTVPSRPTALPAAASAVTRTRSAWGPRSFSPASNSTAWPSRSTFGPPSPTISEACTNTSGEPSSGARKPNPRSASNQRTVPFGIGKLQVGRAALLPVSLTASCPGPPGPATSARGQGVVGGQDTGGGGERPRRRLGAAARELPSSTRSALTARRAWEGAHRADRRVCGAEGGTLAGLVY